MLRRKARGGVVCCKKRMNFLEMQLTRRAEMSMMYYVNLRSATEVSDMSLIKCPKCGEMFSDSYKTCPFCEEDEAYYSGKVRKGRGRRTAESSRRRAPSILGPVAVGVLILLVVLVVWLIFGDRIKAAIDGSENPPITDVDTPDGSPVTTPDDTAVTPTISLNRTVLVLSIGDKESLKVNGTEETVAWSSSDPTVASVTSSGDVTALTKGNAVITAAVGEESVSCTVTVKSEDDTSGDNSTTTKPNDTTKPGDTTTTKPSTGSVDVSKLTLESEYGTTIKPNDGTFDISLPAGLSCSFTVKGTDMTAAWSSADSSIATVSADGTVKTVSRGETTLTIKLGSTEVKCLLRVTK